MEIGNRKWKRYECVRVQCDGKGLERFGASHWSALCLLGGMLAPTNQMLTYSSSRILLELLSGPFLKKETLSISYLVSSLDVSPSPIASDGSSRCIQRDCINNSKSSDEILIRFQCGIELTLPVCHKKLSVDA